MRVRFWMKAFVTVPALCLVGLATDAQQQGSSQQQTGDPVADAARKTRESKKDAPKPKKVYTDDDLKPAAPEPTPSSTAGASNGTQATGKEPGPVPKPAAKARTNKQPKDPNGSNDGVNGFQPHQTKLAKPYRD